MRDDVRQLLLDALPGVATRMKAHNATVPTARLGETAHLRPAIEEALSVAASDLDMAVVVRKEHPFKCTEWESRAGVDLGIGCPPDVRPVFCELKWGDSATALGECSWDLAKMGLAVSVNACSAATLVAGAPQRRWERADLEGPELFVSGQHSLDHLRGPLYLERYWKAYARENLPQPRKLPAVFQTALLYRGEIEFDDSIWELRCVEVTPGGDLVPVEPLPTD
jgi:hypothetical protein